MSNVVCVAIGELHTMAITSDGGLYAWGANSFGQLGNGTTISSASPIRIMDDVIAVSLGHNHSTAITSNATLWAWGNNGAGRLGDGTSTVINLLNSRDYLFYGAEREYEVVAYNNRYTPTRIMNNVAQVNAILGNTLVITLCKELWAWGASFNTSVQGHSPAPLHIMSDVSSLVTVRNGFIITAKIILTDNSLWSWDVGTWTAWDWPEQRPDGGFPTKIMDDVLAVSSSNDNTDSQSSHTLVRRSDGSLWAWGNNISGQLGDGTNEKRYYPVCIMINPVLP